MTKVVLALCALMMSAPVMAQPISGGWELAGEFHCRDRKDGWSNREFNIGYDVSAIYFENTRPRRASTVRGIRFSGGSLRAERRAQFELEGSYTGNQSSIVRFGRYQDIGRLMFQCRSQRSNKRSYMRVLVQRNRRR